MLYTERYIKGKRTTYSYTGDIGEQLIQIGKAAIPSLIKLLDDTNFYFFYEGSESTSNMDYQYRVKDFAAFFLSKITKVPWQFYLDKKKRDIEIERFKKELFKQLAKKRSSPTLLLFFWKIDVLHRYMIGKPYPIFGLKEFISIVAHV